MGKREQEVQRKVKGVVDNLLVELKKEILSVFKQEVAPLIKSTFMEVYDRVANEATSREGPAIRGKDPLSLRNVRHLFEAQVDRELAEIHFEGDALVVSIMNKKALSFGQSESRDGPPVSADVLHFYIEGVAGDFAFITREQKERKSALFGGDNRRIGRVGGGFMISREDYKEEEWQKITNLPFEAVRHPVSGFRPVDDFERAISKVKVIQHVTKAVEQASKNLGIK